MCVLCFALNVLVPTVVDGIRIGLYRHFFHFEQQISGPWTLYHRQGELTHSATGTFAVGADTLSPKFRVFLDGNTLYCWRVAALTRKNLSSLSTSRTAWEFSCTRTWWASATGSMAGVRLCSRLLAGPTMDVESMAVC